MTRPRTGGLVDANSRPAFVPVVTVRLAAQVLPRPARERYRREFVAELYGMTRGQQIRHAGGVLVSVGALLRAVNRRELDIEGAGMKRRPLMCAMNVHHVWRRFSTEDGGRYSRCIRCGRDHPGSSGPTWSVPIS